MRSDIVRVMAHITNSVEYGIHCLLWLVDPASGRPSSRDLAEFQGISPSFVAKIFPKLEKAGIVQAGIGKGSFAEGDILTNAKAFISAIVKARPAGVKGTYLSRVTLSSTMGPGVKVDLTTVGE